MDDYAEKLRYVKFYEAIHLSHTKTAVKVEHPTFLEIVVWLPRSLISEACDESIDTLGTYQRFTLELIEWKADEIA